MLARELWNFTTRSTEARLAGGARTVLLLDGRVVGLQFAVEINVVDGLAVAILVT